VRRGERAGREVDGEPRQTTHQGETARVHQSAARVAVRLRHPVQQHALAWSAHTRRTGLARAIARAFNQTYQRRL